MRGTPQPAPNNPSAPGAARAVGKRMVIVDGRHAGLVAEVRAVEKREGRSDRVTVRLELNEVDVSVRCSELADMGSRTADEAMRAAAGKGAPRAGCVLSLWLEALACARL